MNEPIKPKILAIEDNSINVKLLTIYLQEAGFDVVHAPDGHTGLEIAMTQLDIAAILLDRMMPDMDGLAALKTLKLGAKTWNIPVIMLTAALSSAQVEEAKFVGAYACLPKPYDKEKIIKTLNEALKSRRRT